MKSAEEQKTINALQANWVWTPNWVDSSSQNTAARIATFTREFDLASKPARALLHFSADTRYKLLVNGVRVAVGPSRSSPLIWYYDSADIAAHLREGSNSVTFIVIRYFASSRGGMPFERTTYPGLTVVGSVEADSQSVLLNSNQGWLVRVNNSITFPTGLIDDVFLHINERVTAAPPEDAVPSVPYNIKSLNGELPPWRLHQRVIPMAEVTPITLSTVRKCQSIRTADEWSACLAGKGPLHLAGDSTHVLEVQADVHSTAFLRWSFEAAQDTQIIFKITYSEGYEAEPRSYPFFRTKHDRLDADGGHLIGPFDEVTLDIPASQVVAYEPFWFRTFRIMRWEITTGPQAVTVLPFQAAQANYPLGVKAKWAASEDEYTEQVWDVSIRTLRNCMFDGYSDCPFYEQLQYSGDSRSVSLFHYLLSGDDRLARQAITNFAASITAEGLTQSRFPSHVPQIVAGFSLYWILQVCDHHLHFGDAAYARSFLPRIDGVLDFYDAHVDALGLVSGLPEDVWQYVDWVTAWGATDDHPDKGVPVAGRRSNRHTFFSMLYAYVLQHAARLARDVGRPGHADEYESRAKSVIGAVQRHCFDGRFFTDSTADVVVQHEGGGGGGGGGAYYSQHCQVFAVLSGAAAAGDRARLLKESFADGGGAGFSKCSYVMMFYALRAFALAGDEVYETAWPGTWAPWRRMLGSHLTTWEEDDVRQRSDCHAWGSVPIYEYCTEVAGLHILAPGAARILFRPRLGLMGSVNATVALGSDNTATVSWTTDADGGKKVELRLERAVDVVSQLPGEEAAERGVVKALVLHARTR